MPPNIGLAPLLAPNPAPGLSEALIHAIIDSNRESTKQLMDLSCEANKDMVKEIVHSLLALPVFQQLPTPATSAAPAPVPGAPKPRKYKVPFPKAFDGRSSSVHDFCSSWQNFFYSDPSAYADATAKVRTALSTFDEGSAHIWRNRVIEDIESGAFVVTSWEAFKSKFKDAFLNHYKRDEAAREISNICQGSRPTQDFLIEFDDLALRSEFNDAALVQCLKRALNTRLLREINHCTAYLASFKEWKEAALATAHKIRESDASVDDALNSAHRGSAAASSRWFRPVGNVPVRASASTPQASATPAPNASLPSSMAAPADKFSRPRQDMSSLPCFNCGTLGHFAKTCVHPKNPNIQCQSRSRLERARAVVEDFEALPEDERELIFRMEMGDDKDDDVDFAVGVE
ncbi:hypothetical protein CVT25_012637 [Psilocybe cyanescens]|uniref:CCHC-type domain-containing protein n=1 Tax=Psilocybe cyanescens TaxID=93625 RepID=A0A409XFU1_PSICY|nr:hypothetical protein CVT25_012637 [Psilocybe cyanescens]